MAQLREIKKRIKAVGNIQRITKTMQMIATARFQAAVRRTHATRPYTAKLAEIAHELASAADTGDEPHPLLRPPAEKTGRELLLVLSSNRGFCGGYNANVLRTAAAFIGESDAEIELEVVGKKGTTYFRFAGIPAAQSYTDFSDKPAYEEVEKLGNRYIERFSAGQFDAVRVAYMRFISNARQEPEVLKLLPLRRPEEGEAAAAGGGGDRSVGAGGGAAGPTGGGGEKGRGYRPVFEFSPDPATLLGELLPLTVKSQLFQCFNEAVVSEQIARMVAMKAATDNAGKVGRTLRRKYNRARQAQITTELSEIIGGAAALQ